MLRDLEPSLTDQCVDLIVDLFEFIWGYVFPDKSDDWLTCYYRVL